MKSIYLNDIKQKELIVHQANTGYYKIFDRLIFPYIRQSDIEFWTRIQCLQMCQVEKQSSKVYLFYDKFFILNHCLTTDTKDLVKCYEQLKKQLSEDDCIKLFNHSKLTTKIFINLVGSSETSYHSSRGKTPLEEPCDG